MYDNYIRKKKKEKGARGISVRLLRLGYNAIWVLVKQIDRVFGVYELVSSQGLGGSSFMPSSGCHRLATHSRGTQIITA